MYLIVGLGNPGRTYEGTRHNMGFDTIDYLIEEHRIPQSGVKFNAMYGKGIIGGEKVILMKPLSWNSMHLLRCCQNLPISHQMYLLQSQMHP